MAKRIDRTLDGFAQRTSVKKSLNIAHFGAFPYNNYDETKGTNEKEIKKQ